MLHSAFRNQPTSQTSIDIISQCLECAHALRTSFLEGAAAVDGEDVARAVEEAFHGRDQEEGMRREDEVPREVQHLVVDQGQVVGKVDLQDHQEGRIPEVEEDEPHQVHNHHDLQEEGIVVADLLAPLRLVAAWALGDLWLLVLGWELSWNVLGLDHPAVLLKLVPDRAKKRGRGGH